ncbi:tetraacyldisaccharide 4'-kinase [Rubrivivax gelatinosus]|uniref:Tetraacyldisaccharide 4'-kinase n=1 Tax=Rubrivivax gelatinosus TaxID=28068 RepID=A0A4R2MF27_RUBGE|nr:tetraacyldisaccharide 4'-kinase [Rubrivivax gelatinosus]MBK1688847.1 tetraacyldisaccharide 4'-kinase [Rubrivivax gelatinosus]TCP03114.1 lipid-A-disaccharide kinase [Rubrivivax gelatinosus]
MSLAARLEALLLRHWWQPRRTALAATLAPLESLYAGLSRRAADVEPRRAPVPVVVVGNLIVGGAGKTPTVIALVRALQAAGYTPGVISRGFGRDGDGVCPVEPDASPAEVGDEPLLIRRRTAVPVWVGRDRLAAARALCAAHPEVDVLVSDDGLQHRRLARDAEIVVFDDRGVGNGRLLPAGPLREPLPAQLAPGRFVLYNAPAPTTALPGACALRTLGPAVALEDWAAGRPTDGVALETLHGRPFLALAGIASPERFFTMLEAAGLEVDRLPLPDHHDFATLPWPAGTPQVLVTEKDAVKLAGRALGGTRVWVVGLDFTLPDSLVQDVLRLLAPPRTR